MNNFIDLGGKRDMGLGGRSVMWIGFLEMEWGVFLEREWMEVLESCRVGLGGNGGEVVEVGSG